MRLFDDDMEDVEDTDDGAPEGRGNTTGVR
jgi:hypothetical protein